MQQGRLITQFQQTAKSLNKPLQVEKTRKGIRPTTDAGRVLLKPTMPEIGQNKAQLYRRTLGLCTQDSPQ